MVTAGGQVARDKFYVSFDLARNHQGWRALGLITLSIDKTAASEKGNVWIKPWISSNEDEPDALSVSLEGRCGTDPVLAPLPFGATQEWSGEMMTHFPDVGRFE